MLGQTIGGRYQIIRYLGGGGFGQTYLAEDLHLPRKPRCVVKQLKPKASHDPIAMQTARRLFDREAEVLYSLGNHDQIPRLFAHFEENHEFYLVQEFIDGQVFNRELRKQKVLPEEQVILLLQDILTTLEFVHQQQVIHRDIKPSNLIRRKADGKMVLIDFGAVKQIGIQTSGEFDIAELEQTSATMAIGSSGYIPNEQLAGKPRLSSDIYAVGIVAIRALTGLHPSQLIEDPKTGELLWRTPAMSIHPDLSKIIDTMVRYDFRQRYQSAADALAALASLGTSNDTVNLAVAAHSDSSRVGVMDGHLAWLERGDDLFHRQRYQEAFDCYDRAIQMRSDDYLAWFKRGMTLENLHRYEEAIASYDNVIQLRKDDYLAWFKRGKVLENLHRHEDALSAYVQVIQIQPGNYWAWHDRGRILEQFGQYEDAVAAYDRAVQLKPDFQLAIESRKRVLSQLQQVDQLYHLQHYDEAIASCDRAIETQPDDALAWLMRGMAQENSQNYSEAIASYSRVVEIQPDDHVAWYKRGILLEKLHRFGEALGSYDQVVRIQPDNCWAWHDRGRVLVAMQCYEEAMASYDEAIHLKPDFQSAVEARQQTLQQWKRDHALQKETSELPQPTPVEPVAG